MLLIFKLCHSRIINVFYGIYLADFTLITHIYLYIYNQMDFSLQIQNSPVFTNNLGLAKVNLQRQKGARSLLAPGEGEDIFTPPQQSEVNQMPK